MSKLEKILIIVVGIVLIFIALNTKNIISNQSFGSVARSGEYISTTTRTAITGIPYTQLNAITGTSTTVSGTLGSIVITGANTGTINIYDATSTNTNSQIGTTTLATIPASTAAGTYVFDISFTKGLVIESTGLVASSTITYRTN